MKNIKLGVVFSGGGARGLAHIGMIKVFEREKIQPAFISGTSMGAIIGAAYASGMSAAELEKVAVDITRTRNMIRMVHVTQPTKSLIDVEKLRAFLTTILPEHMEFSQLKTPLAVCAVDLITGKTVTLRSGKVIPAILASSALPGVFQPVEIHPFRLVDGGVLNNLPVDLAFQLGAEKVIAVDVQERPQSNYISPSEKTKSLLSLPLPNYFYELLRSEVIMTSRLTEINLQIYPPDLLIEMPITSEITAISGYNRAEEIIRLGEETTEKYLPKIKALLGSD